MSSRWLRDSLRLWARRELFQEETLPRSRLAFDDLVGRAQRDAGGEKGLLRFPFRDPDQAIALVVDEVGRVDVDAAGRVEERLAHLAHRLRQRLPMLGLRPVKDHENEAHAAHTSLRRR